MRVELADEEFPYGSDEGAGKSKKNKKKQKGTGKKGSTKYYAEQYDDEFDSDDYGEWCFEPLRFLSMWLSSTSRHVCLPCPGKRFLNQCPA